MQKKQAKLLRSDVFKRLEEEEGPSYMMELSYIGSPFHGFQSQVSGRGIQNHIEKALKTLLKHSCYLRGASRTDSGVHAQGQVAIFRTKTPFKDSWLLSLNALTPTEIGIKSIKPVARDFDPIVDPTGKAYRYRIWRGRCFNPFLSPYVWEISDNFSLEILRSEIQSFTGSHDFAAFCNADSSVKTTERRILEVHIEERGPLVEIWIVGEGFLKQMVRIMVGTLIAVANGRMPTGSVKKLLKKGKTREDAGKTAQAQGLCLVEIFFDEIPKIEEIIKKAEKGFTLAL